MEMITIQFLSSQPSPIGRVCNMGPTSQLPSCCQNTDEMTSFSSFMCWQMPCCTYVWHTSFRPARARNALRTAYRRNSIAPAATCVNNHSCQTSSRCSCSSMKFGANYARQTCRDMQYRRVVKWHTLTSWHGCFLSCDPDKVVDTMSRQTSLPSIRFVADACGDRRGPFPTFFASRTPWQLRKRLLAETLQRRVPRKQDIWRILPNDSSKFTWYWDCVLFADSFA